MSTMPPHATGQPGGAAPSNHYAQERAKLLSTPVERYEPRPRPEAREQLLAMARSGGPLRTLGELYLRWEEMLARERQVIWLAIAGAYIPFGLGTVLRRLIEHHLIDVLVTTPAQLTHDLTEVRGLHHYQGSPDADDNTLQALDVNRYWNVYGDEQELNTNEDVIFDFAETLDPGRAYTASEYFYRLGRWLDGAGRRHKGADGMVTTAARLGLPIFCPSPGDGDITTDLAHYRKRTGRRIVLDAVKETLDMVALNAAVEDHGGRAGLITLGGGAPRNYAQQAMACAYMLDRPDLKRYNYGLRISLDPVQTGGLSGSTISEGKTWKKYATDTIIAEHFGDFMTALAQMADALLAARAQAPRPPGVTVCYTADGRLLVTVRGREIDAQQVYGYA
jgi:deoxyhypusine synthase